jgi:hypothetical protein
MRLQRLVACLVALSCIALAPAAPPTTPSPAPKTTSSQALPSSVVPLTYRCPAVNVTFQLTPTGADAAGWTGHNENKSNLQVAAVTKRGNLGVEYDTMICVYTLQTDGKTLQDNHVTIVERNAPPQYPVCDGRSEIMGFVCRQLKPGEKYDGYAH